MKFKTIANRIFVFIIPTVVLTTVTFSILSYQASSSRINEMIDEKMHEGLQVAKLEIQLELEKNAAVAVNFAIYGKRLSSETFNHIQHRDYLESVIKSNENTFGGGVWFEPYMFSLDLYYFGPFLYVDDGEAHYANEYADYADYFNENWYQNGKNSEGEIVWSIIYYDPFSTVTMVTASKAFYSADGTFLGMGTADMSVETIRRIVDGISVGNTGKAFILGEKGEYISFIDDGKNIGDMMYLDADETLAKLGMELAENESGSTVFMYNGKHLRVYYATLPGINWKLAVTIEEAEISSSAMSYFAKMTIIPFLGLLLVILGIFMVIAYLRKIITKVNDFADKAASGNLTNRIEVAEKDEFGVMEQHLNTMISKMNDINACSAELLKMEEESAKLMKAMNSAAVALLAADDDKFEESLREGMELVGCCMGVDRIYIWQDEIRDGILHYVQKFEWLNDIGREGSTVLTLTGFPYSTSIPEWESIFFRGECINGPFESLTQNAKEQLGSYNIKSLLVIPVYLQNRFSGFVSFDDCHSERTFTEDEVSILRSASLMMASAMLRSETAAKMREADERTRIMLDAMPLCCNLWDKDLNCMDCNEEAVKLFGLKDKQEYIDRFFELSPEYQPDGRHSAEKARESIFAAFRDGGAVFEWLHQIPDGTPMPAEVTLARVKRGDEFIVAGYTRDLREYKKMMNEIKYKGALLRMVNDVASILLQSEIDEFDKNLLRCMGIMAASVSADRMYISKNYKKEGHLYCTQLYEWSEGAEPQQGGKYVNDVPYNEKIVEWNEILPKGQCVNNVVRDMSPGAQAHLTPQNILSVLVVPVFLRGQFWGFVGFDDCTRERLFTGDEEVILRSGSLLITNALLRNEMTLGIRTAVEEAQSASRAKSNFLSNMSHEIRTPLNAISGMTLIGKSSPDTERKNYALGKIEDASNHLMGVISDILDMSKIEASKFELSEVEFAFEKMLQKVVSVVSFRVDEKRQNLSVYIGNDIPQTLVGDDQRLAQVITNLLSNAVKFTPENGSVRLDAHMLNEEKGVCEILIEVTDNGIGINPERHSRLFDSFEQADSNISRQYGGTGLGLAISKHIVELMGGRIWFESGPGKGSKFSFTIRVKRGEEEDRCHIPLNTGVNWKNIRVLAVDDEKEIREYFADITGHLGIACDTAGSGEEALGLVESGNHYHIYFVDWRMPGMNGIELSRRIKARDAERSIVIMISAVEWHEIENEARQAGVTKFLQKPLFPSSIADCINEYLGRKNILDAAEKTDEAICFRGRRILLAEDVELNREIMMALLEPTFIEVECASTGAEAVRMFESAPESYDMIFMDVQMPEMDGLEATRRIRALDCKKAVEIPIVAMTANVFREDIEKCVDAGMNEHVGKPMDFNEVLKIMKHYLNQNS